MRLTRLLPVVWVLLLCARLAASQGIPELATPEAYFEYFSGQANSSEDLALRPIPRITRKEVSLPTPEQTLSIDRANNFLAGLQGYSKFLASRPTSEAMLQYKGMVRVKRSLETVPSWGTTIMSRSVSLVILRDVFSRLKARSLTPEAALGVLDKAYVPLGRKAVLAVFSVESPEFQGALESWTKTRPGLPEEVLTTQVLFKIDGDVASMPLSTLDSGNLAGLIDYAKFEGLSLESVKLFATYVQRGGAVAVTPEEFQARFKVLMADLTAPSVDGKEVNALTVSEVTQVLVELP